MRYIRRQIKVITTTDAILDDLVDIKNLLQKIARGSVDLSIQYQDPGSGIVRNHKKCRFKRVGEDSLDIKILQQSGSFHDNNIPIENVLSVDITTKQQNFEIHNPDLSRFGLLDIGEQGGELDE